jgi:hypothetical protein
MSSLVVRPSFWNSPVVQHLRSHCPKEVRFRQSENVRADLLFPFCASSAFTILYPDKLNESGITEIESMVKVYSNSTLVICLSQEESNVYANFLSIIPTQVAAVVCFPPDSFAQTAAKFIWETASKAKVVRNNIERLVEERRRLSMDPDVQAGRIIDELLVGDSERRAALKTLLNTQTGTIRKTLTEGIPELFAKDFYIETQDEEEGSWK